ncbi:hypothetical protein Fuma_06267 [Fuerstiella marisgermanici]|uniref:Uncharacterized protein n=1 Tax=Fuerstiella marisgermanici TaxID=1891926 RepID=A0A1P8WRA6_9PLAN|nr:hypothetical protein Fuma_06267 [Fuerstiella marisgermanici]
MMPGDTEPRCKTDVSSYPWSTARLLIATALLVRTRGTLSACVPLTEKWPAARILANA